MLPIQPQHRWSPTQNEKTFQDHAALLEAGVAAIYGPGTRVPSAALGMLGLLMPEQDRGTAHS